MSKDKLKVYGKRCHVIGKNIDKETKEFADEMDKLLQHQFETSITKIDGLDFHLTCQCFPEQYDIYKGDKYVAYFRLRYGTITVDEIKENEDFGVEICEYTLKNGNGWEGEFRNKKERALYLRFCAKWVNTFLQSGKTQSDMEKKRKPKSILDKIEPNVFLQTMSNLFEDLFNKLDKGE